MAHHDKSAQNAALTGDGRDYESLVGGMLRRRVAGGNDDKGLETIDAWTISEDCATPRVAKEAVWIGASPRIRIMTEIVKRMMHAKNI